VEREGVGPRAGSTAPGGCGTFARPVPDADPPELPADLPPRLPAETPTVTTPLARMLNVFAAPGAVFDEVRGTPPARSNWLLPAILSALVLALAALAFSASPEFQKQWRAQTEKFQAGQTNAVAAGKLSPAQAEENRRVFASVARPAVLISLAVWGGFVFGALRVFWWAGVLWAVARWFLRRPVRYIKTLEVAGLTSLIATLASLVLVLASSPTGAGAAGLASPLGGTEAARGDWLVILLLGAMNVWVVVVLGVGLARLTQLPWRRPALLIFAYWLTTDLLLALLAGAG